MDTFHLTGSSANWTKRLRGLAVLGLALCFAAPAAKAAMLFDDVSVTSTRFALAEGSMATGIKLTLNGLHLPGEPSAPARSLAFEVVKIGTDAENVAIALTAETGIALDAAQLADLPKSEATRQLVTLKQVTAGTLSATIQRLDPPGRAVLATICASMADPTTVAAALGHLAQTDQPSPKDLFQTAVQSLATGCRASLAKAGITSGGFIRRDRLPARLLNSADGLLSAGSVTIDNWMGNASDARMTGSILTLREVDVIGPDLQNAPKKRAATSLLWDGQIDVATQRRIALYGRVSQYPGAVSGLFDAADDLTIDIKPKAPVPDGLDAAIADSSRESLVLVEHVLSNLPLIEAAALEARSPSKIDISGALPAEAAAYASVASFGDDVSAVLDKVRAALFKRAYPDEKAVLALQDKLTKWQLYDGAVDGKTGPKTRAAFAAFERIVSGSANGTPSDMESAALPLWSAGPPPAPPPLAGSLADALMPEEARSVPAEVAAKLQTLEDEAATIRSDLASAEADLAAIEADSSPRIRALETLLADCYCQGGRLCP